jgi:hypothetical protein
MHIENKTSLPLQAMVVPNEHGKHELIVVVKATFDSLQALKLASDMQAIHQKDIFWAKPQTSSLRYANEMHLGKPGTDILMHAHAYARNGQAVRQSEVSIQVAQYSLNLRIFGDRNWQGKQASSMKQFVRIPLVYEYAFGAPMNEFNPVGRSETLLANIEDPQALVESVKSAPMPTCPGPIASHWKTRYPLAGTYDQHWEETRLPYLPADYDRRFNHSAHPQLQTIQPLKGGEPYRLQGVHPVEVLEGKLPFCPLKLEVALNDKTNEHPIELPLKYDTVHFEPDSDQVHISWRANHVCLNNAKDIISISMDFK